MSVVLLFYCPLLSGSLLNTLAVHRFWWNFSQRKLLVKLFVVNFIVALMGNKKSNRCLFSAGGSRFGITYLFFKGNGVGRGERGEEGTTHYQNCDRRVSCEYIKGWDKYTKNAALLFASISFLFSPLSYEINFHWNRGEKIFIPDHWCKWFCCLQRNPIRRSSRWFAPFSSECILYFLCSWFFSCYLPFWKLFSRPILLFSYHCCMGANMENFLSKYMFFLCKKSPFSMRTSLLFVETSPFKEFALFLIWNYLISQRKSSSAQ